MESWHVRSFAAARSRETAAESLSHFEVGREQAREHHVD